MVHARKPVVEHAASQRGSDWAVAPVGEAPFAASSLLDHECKADGGNCLGRAVLHGREARDGLAFLTAPLCGADPGHVVLCDRLDGSVREPGENLSAAATIDAYAAASGRRLLAMIPVGQVRALLRLAPRLRRAAVSNAGSPLAEIAGLSFGMSVGTPPPPGYPGGLPIPTEIPVPSVSIQQWLEALGLAGNEDTEAAGAGVILALAQGVGDWLDGSLGPDGLLDDESPNSRMVGDSDPQTSEMPDARSGGTTTGPDGASDAPDSDSRTFGADMSEGNAAGRQGPSGASTGKTPEILADGPDRAGAGAGSRSEGDGRPSLSGNASSGSGAAEEVGMPNRTNSNTTERPRDELGSESTKANAADIRDPIASHAKAPDEAPTAMKLTSDESRSVDAAASVAQRNDEQTVPTFANQSNAATQAAASNSLGAEPNILTLAESGVPVSAALTMSRNADRRFGGEGLEMTPAPSGGNVPSDDIAAGLALLALLARRVGSGWAVDERAPYGEAEFGERADKDYPEGLRENGSADAKSWGASAGARASGTVGEERTSEAIPGTVAAMGQDAALYGPSIADVRSRDYSRAGGSGRKGRGVGVATIRNRNLGDADRSAGSDSPAAALLSGPAPRSAFANFGTVIVERGPNILGGLAAVAIGTYSIVEVGGVANVLGGILAVALGLYAIFARSEEPAEAVDDRNRLWEQAMQRVRLPLPNQIAKPETSFRLSDGRLPGEGIERRNQRIGA